MAPTLRRRILVGYGLVLALLAVVIAAALVAFARLGRSSETIVRENYQSIRAADGMIDALERQDSGVLLYLLGGGDGAARQVTEHQTAFDGWVARASANLTIPGEGDYVARIRQADTGYRRALDDVLTRPPPDPASARTTYRERLFPTFLRVREAASALRDLNQQTMAEAADRDRDASRTGVAALALLGGGALLFGLAFSILLSARLAAPVRRLEAAARRVATGDYDAEVQEDSEDELGRLAAAFNEMAAALRLYRALESERAVQAQRRSAAVVQAIEDGIVVVDARLGVLDLNPAAAAALGTSPGAARGRRLDEMAPAAPFLAAVSDAAAGRMPGSAEAGFVSARDHEFEVVVTPMTGPSGAPLGALLLLRDVTALRQLDRMKSAFVATASHELRTPVTSLGMSVELLGERLGPRLDARERALLDAASEDVGRLRALVDDLLDLSRIEAGRLELAPEPVAPAALVEDAIAAFAVPAEAAGLSLAADVTPGLPLALADVGRIRRVLANLLSNAVRHTLPGGHLAVRALADGPDAVRFEVEDTGEGIAPEDQARIFERFVQVAGSRAAGGSGLGLTLAKELIEAHGGAIGVTSKPGEGSLFWFTLPAAEPAGLPAGAEGQNA
jgi:NtrC-family two-component system sensor histidine kinase KinB